MTNTDRLQSAHSPNSAAPPSYPAQDLSIRDILVRWIGTDETLRAALTAHSSSSLCRAEEERTRQEYYRLETRRVEYELLREAFRSGIHPSLIPQLFSQDRAGGPQNLSPVSPIQRQEERTLYPTSSLPSYNRHDLPRIDTSNLPPPGANRSHLVPHRQKYTGPISAPPASMATTSPPPSIFFRHWAPPQRSADDVQLRSPRDTSERYHHPDQQIPSPSSSRKTPPLHNGISPKRSTHVSSHNRQRSEAAVSGKMLDNRHHPYPSRIQSRKHDDEGPGLGATKSPLDRETVMRALREKVAPRKEDEDLDKRESERRDSEKRDTEKKEAEKKKVDSTTTTTTVATRGDVMALEQLVESSNGVPQQV